MSLYFHELQKSSYISAHFSFEVFSAQMTRKFLWKFVVDDIQFLLHSILCLVVSVCFFVGGGMGSILLIDKGNMGEPECQSS